MPRKINFLLFLVLLITSCSDSSSTATQPGNPAEPTMTIVAPESTSTSIPQTTVTPTPQPFPTPITLGPDQFPEGYNPLSGQRVSDPAQLTYPALLLSVSHFPPAARPQAGFSFAPFVYEYYITEGSTRHLAVFYGEFPAPEIPLYGDCETRKEPMTQTKFVLGNRVWEDKNQNGIQDPREGGIGGICVHLLDANGNLLQQMTTDSNGYFGFNVDSGKYSIEVEKPSWLEFTQKNIGEEATDSDVDSSSGRTDPIEVSNSSLLFWDAGLVSSPNV